MQDIDQRPQQGRPRVASGPTWVGADAPPLVPYRAEALAAASPLDHHALLPYSDDDGRALGRYDAPLRFGSTAGGSSATLPAARASGGIAASPRFSLDDSAVGTSHDEAFQIFNTERDDATLQVRYEGSPFIALLAAPERLGPSRDGIDRNAAIKLRFAPQAKGHYTGMLYVRASWQAGDHAPQTLEIPIEAAAHEVGEPDLADQEAAQRQQAQAQRDSDRSDRDAERAFEAHEDAWQHDRVPGTPATREELHAASNLAMHALDRLLVLRSAGVAAAQRDADKYHRRVPPHHESLLHALAMAALDVATASIAGAIAKELELSLLAVDNSASTRVFSTGREGAANTWNPTKAVVASITDGVKETVKKTEKSATSSGGHDGSDESRGDAVSDFFLTEQAALSSETAMTAEDTIVKTQYALEPMLATEPKKAVAAMRAVRDSFEKLTKSREPAEIQHRESARHWTRYVAQTSLGSTADGRTNIAKANVAPKDDALGPVDGLVQLDFIADAADPSRPVELSHARVTGVSNAVAKQLVHTDKPLLETGIPIRAAAAPTARDAVVELEAIRDEAGNVQYSDKTGAGGTPSNWFARKVGQPHGGRDAELLGARSVIQELAVQVDKDVLANRDYEPKTDSDDK